MTTPATRLITLIMLLQRQPMQRAADLAEALGVSVRTIHRYFQALEEMGIPIYSERGRHGGFSLVRGYKLPPMVFTPDEAVALCLGTNLVSEMWGDLYTPSAHSAQAKLENVLPKAQLSEIDHAQRTLVATGLHYIELGQIHPRLEQIRDATRQLHRVRLTYQSSSAPLSERQVDPYALVHRHGWWYLIGHCHLRRDLRTFRIDRIQSLTVLETDFDWPEDFDIRAYLEAEWSDPSLIKARLLFCPDATHTVNANLVYWDTARINPDGSTEVSITATDLDWLASFVMGFAHWVTILEPPQLRQQVKTWATKTAAQYP